jgi:hypothetical protein
MRIELTVLGGLVLSLGLSSACVVISDDVGNDEVGDGDGTTTVGDGDGDPTTGDGDGDPTTGDGDGDGDGDPTTGDGDGDPTTGDGDGDPTTGDGDGDGDCQAADPSVAFSYASFDFGQGDPWSTDIDWACTASVADTTNGLYLELACPDAPAEAPDPIIIDINATPTFLPPLTGGETVQVRYISEGPWWFNVHLRLDVEGYGHLLTLIDGDSLVPPDPYVWDPPFALTPVYDLCTPFADGCGDLERLALDMEVNGEPNRVWDSSHAIVGGDPGTDVWVVDAGLLHEIQCSDTPDEWYRVLIADTGLE